MVNTSVINSATPETVQPTSTSSSSSTPETVQPTSFSYLTLFIWLFTFFIIGFLVYNCINYANTGSQNINDLIASLGKDITQFFEQFNQSATSGSDSATSGSGTAPQGYTKETINSSKVEKQNAAYNTPQITSPQLNSKTTTPNTKTTSIKSKSDSGSDSDSDSDIGTKSKSGSGTDYKASVSHTTVNTTGKSGWCYVGTDRGFRTCAQVSAKNKCMSGDIFPTNDLCINPKLRS
jgi:hypothetical protein